MTDNTDADQIEMLEAMFPDHDIPVEIIATQRSGYHVFPVEFTRGVSWANRRRDAAVAACNLANQSRTLCVALDNIDDHRSLCAMLRRDCPDLKGMVPAYEVAIIRWAKERFGGRPALALGATETQP